MIHPISRMKRVLNALDHFLVTIWALLFLFFAVVLSHWAIPEKWRPEVETRTTVEMTAILLCGLSAIRFLAYMDYAQWIAAPTLAIVTFIYWARPGPALSLWHLCVAGVPGTMIVVLVFVPLHKWAPIKIKMRLPWQKKQHKAAKLAQQAMDLKARIESKKE